MPDAEIKLNRRLPPMIGFRIPLQEHCKAEACRGELMRKN